MPCLSADDKQLIKAAMYGMSVEIQTATIAKLYLAPPANPSQWMSASLEGAIVLLKDKRQNNAFFFRMVDMVAGKVTWEQELYRDFEYEKENAFFHTFALDNCMAGLSFAEEQDASTFYDRVKRQDLSYGTRPMSSSAAMASAAPSSRGSSAGVNGTYQPSASTVASPATAVSLSLFNKKGKPGNKAASKGKLNKAQIGAPSNFVHVSHLGFDPKQGKFDQRNIPPEWNEIFKKAGVTTEQLQDKKTAEFLAKFVAQNTAADGRPLAGRAPPPPPPPSNNAPSSAPPGSAAANRLRGAPPPPPPARQPLQSSTLPRSQNAPPPPPPPANRAAYSANTLPPPPSAAAAATMYSSPSFGDGGAPPPPPPPPPLPPVSAPYESQPLPPPTPARQVPAVPDVRNSLMNSIRGAQGVASLKKASERVVAAPPPAEDPSAADSADLAGALKLALSMRKDAMFGEGSEESDENDGDDQDDDWE